MRDPNACDALPDGIDGVEAGIVCPHNVYHHHADEFAARDAVADTLERLFRLVGSADAGLMTESDLDIFSITELLTAKNELNRQEIDKQKEARNRNTEAPSGEGLPSWN